MTNKRSFDQGHHTEYSKPQHIQQQQGPNMKHGYEQKHGAPQDFIKAHTDPNSLPRSLHPLVYASLDHVIHNLHYGRRIGDKYQPVNPFGARFPTHNPFHNHTHQITLVVTPLTQAPHHTPPATHPLIPLLDYLEDITIDMVYVLFMNKKIKYITVEPH